ncbi:MAG: hypothetical protein QOH90_2298, partial [Actinomycetota bacterium]|nr:hypothetical protein [Actinomycetota bacterium]
MKRLPRPRLSLLAKFGVMSVIPILLSTLILGPGLGRLVREQNLAVIQQQAVLLANLRLDPHLTDVDLAGEMSAHDAAAMDELLASKVLQGYVSGLKIWSKDGTLIYSSDHDGVGTSQPVSGLLAQALNGQPSADPRFAGTPDDADGAGPNVFV